MNICVANDFVKAIRSFSKDERGWISFENADFVANSRRLIDPAQILVLVLTRCSLQGKFKAFIGSRMLLEFWRGCFCRCRASSNSLIEVVNAKFLSSFTSFHLKIEAGQLSDTLKRQSTFDIDSARGYKSVPLTNHTDSISCPGSSVAMALMLSTMAHRSFIILPSNS